MSLSPINVNIKVYIRPDVSADIKTVLTKVNEVLSLLTQITTQEAHMSAAMDALEAQVAQTTSISQSAIVLIQGIAQQLAEALADPDPAKVQELKQRLSVSATSLAAAIAANTPPTPPAEPPPAPVEPPVEPTE